jgi:hypothetical protein
LRRPPIASDLEPIRNSLRSTPVWLYVVGALALGFYLVNALHFGKEPLRIEEREWPPMAEAVLEHGKPIVYANETRRLRLEPDLSYDHQPVIGAWHPPLYLYAAGVYTGILGTHSGYWLRSLGMLGLLCTAALLLLIAREVTSRWRYIGGAAAILLLIHPFAIQGSVFLDIDTSIYSALAFLVIWLAVRFGKREGPLTIPQILALGGALGLVCWAKLTTTIVLVIALGLWWLLSRRPLRRTAVEAVAFIGTGVALFFSTYAIWCHLADVPFSYTFHVTFGEKSNRLFSEWLVVEHQAHWHVRWFGAALLILAVIYLVDLLRNLVSSRRLRPLDLPFIFGLGVFLLYVFVSPTDGTYGGKYTFSAVGALLLPISWMLLRSAREMKHRTLLWIGAAVIGIVTALLLPDELTGLAEFNVHYGTWHYEAVLALAAGAALLLAWLLGGRRGFGAGVLVVLAALSIGQAVRSYQANTSPLYPIPDTNEFLAAAADLNHYVPKGDIISTPKDLSIYVPRRNIEGEEAFARGDALLAEKMERDPKFVAFARDSFGPPVGPKTEAVLNRCFTERHEFGSASVAYRSRPCR